MKKDKYGEIVHSTLREAKLESIKIEKYICNYYDTSKVSQVISALLARQYKLLWSISNSPSSLNHDAAPLFLRAMADVHINISYISQDPYIRSEEYIKYGLGDELLQYNHRKNYIDNCDDEEEKESLKPALEVMEGWIEFQRAIWSIDINLGQWSGENTRKMAEEAGEDLFYKFVYKPFSACVHSTWGHVGKVNVRHCEEVMHFNHLVGNYDDPYLDLHYLELSFKYMQKTLDYIRDKLLSEMYIYPEYDLLYALYKRLENFNPD